MKKKSSGRSGLLTSIVAAIAILFCGETVSADLYWPEAGLTWRNSDVAGRNEAVYSIERDSHGLMWLGTDAGLYMYDGVSARPVGTSETGRSQIYALVEHDGRLYAGGNRGLFVYDYSTGKVSQYHNAPKEIRCLAEAEGALWIGGLSGLYRLDHKSGKLTDMSAGLPDRSVYSLLRDSRGVLYAGTYDGLSRLTRRGGKITPVKGPGDVAGGCNLFVNSMLEDPDGEGLYIGTEGALYFYSPVNESWRRIAALDGNNIKSLALTAEGDVLAGTHDGIFEIGSEGVKRYRHDSRHELSLSDNEIWSIFVDDRHNIWAGHERGFSVASASDLIRTVKLGALTRSGEGNEIHAIMRDSRGDLWFGGTNGVLRMSGATPPEWYRHAKESHSLSHNRIRDIKEDTAGRVWLSTDGGLNRYSPLSDSFDIFHIADKEGRHGSNWVYAFDESGDDYWVGAFLSGLHRVAKAKMEGTGGIVTADLSLRPGKTEENGRNAKSGVREVLASDLISDMLTDRDGNVWVILFGHDSLLRYSPRGGKSESYDIREMCGESPAVICLDKEGRVWCAFNGGAVVFGRGRTPVTVRLPETNSDESVLAAGAVGDGIWLSTQSNVWNISGTPLKATLLPIPQKRYTAIYDDLNSQRVLLGGTDEIVSVDSRNLEDTEDYKAIRLILKDNEDGSLNLTDPLGLTRGLTVAYGGTVGFTVSTLDYSPGTPQRFMYCLSSGEEDDNADWVVMPEGYNHITLSDLRPGKYRLLLKAAGAAGAPLVVPLRVRMPWYLSWWAVMSYAAVLVGLIITVIWYMRRRAHRALREQERQATLENVETKLTFLSGISHDLKTPLSMILGPVSLLKEKEGDPDSRKMLEAVYDNAVRLNAMIHRTLELQEMDGTEGGMMITSTFDIVALCRDITALFRRDNPRKNLIFHSSCEEQIIEADAVKMESILSNLLSNACKYSGDGATVGVGITVKNDKVEIAVTDDGPGIADSEQTLVFQRMFRSPATSGLHEGTGLGLYLIKKYLDLMNGDITLYSQEGQGSTFVVTLPIAERKTVPAEAQTAVDGEGKKPRILIVEDNREIAGFIAGILKGEYECMTAEDGRAGLSVAASVLPDLIIADEMMPVMSGLDMVRELKRNPRLSAVPVILLTAKCDSSTENASILAGVDVFMTKPFEPEVLRSRIAQLLRYRREVEEKIRVRTIAEAESRPIEAESAAEKSLATVARVIEDNISDPDLNVNMLCEKCGMQNKQLYRLVKKYMGVAPLDYIRSIRLQKAAALLGQKRFTVSEISYMVGFKTPSYFAKCFKEHYGVTPAQYGAENAGEETKTSKTDE